MAALSSATRMNRADVLDSLGSCRGCVTMPSSDSSEEMQILVGHAGQAAPG